MDRTSERRTKEEALLSVCAYIDLNPVAAGIVALPEESPHTSIRERVEHVKNEGRIADVSEIRNGSVADGGSQSFG